MHTLTVPTIEEQTNYPRPYPQALRQNTEVISGVYAYDFNTHNPAFIAYLTRRGLSHLTGKQKGAYHRLINDHATNEPILNMICNRRLDGHIYTTKELSNNWHRFRITKGKLQDAWELFLTN